jgi:hypothetical protein
MLQGQPLARGAADRQSVEMMNQRGRMEGEICSQRMPDGGRTEIGAKTAESSVAVWLSRIRWHWRAKTTEVTRLPVELGLDAGTTNSRSLRVTAMQRKRGPRKISCSQGRRDGRGEGAVFLTVAVMLRSRAEQKQRGWPSKG